MLGCHMELDALSSKFRIILVSSPLPSPAKTVLSLFVSHTDLNMNAGWLASCYLTSLR